MARLLLIFTKNLRRFSEAGSPGVNVSLSTARFCTVHLATFHVRVHMYGVRCIVCIVQNVTELTIRSSVSSSA